MSGGRFGFLFASTLVVVFFLKVAVPFFLLSSDICDRAGESCGVLTLLFGFFGGIVTVLVFMAATIIIFYRRTIAARLSSRWMLAVIFLAWEANGFIYGAGNFWPASFSVGLILQQPPYTLIGLIGLGIFLSLYEPATVDELPKSHRLAWKVAAWSVGILCATGSSLLLHGFAMGSGLPVHIIAPLTALAMFLLSLTFILAASTNDRSGPSQGARAQPPRDIAKPLDRTQFGRRGP